MKEKVFKIAFRPAMMFEAECWSVKKYEENKLDVAEPEDDVLDM